MNPTDIIAAIRAALQPPAPEAIVVQVPSGAGGLYLRHRDYLAEALPAPVDYRPSHCFDDLDDFAGWIRRELETGRWLPEAVEVLVGESSVAAVKMSRELGAQAVVSCRLSHHPLWAMWGRLCRDDLAPIPTADLYQALRPLKGTFAGERVRVDGKDRYVPIADSVLSGLRSISVSSGGDASVEMDTGGMVRLASKSGKVETGAKPRDSWPLVLPVFACAEHDRLSAEVLVSWRVNGDKTDLAWSLSMPLRPLVESEARRLVVGHLRDKLPELTIGLGEFGVKALRAT